MIEAVLLSILANIATEAGKALFIKRIGNTTIVERIEKAFDRALKKWSVNKDIRERELLHLDNRTLLLKQIATHSITNQSIDPNIKELLDFFKFEIMSDGVAYNLLIDDYFQNSIERDDRVEMKLDALRDIIVDSYKNHNTNEQSATTEILPIQIEPKKDVIPHNYFIQHLQEDPLYIPRKLINYKNIGKEEIFFNLQFDTPKEDEYSHLAELIHNKSRIVVLGNAGTGKSVELKETAIKLAKAGTFFPIFISLNSYTIDKNIEESINAVWREIPESDIVLFLDGLDEIEPQFINASKRKISSFSTMFPNVNMVISCRTNFYDLPTDNKVGTLREFEPFHLAELTISDVIKYVYENHQIDGQTFINAIYQNNFSDLVFNPFFLKLLIQNYKLNNNAFSRNRVEIFREFINSRIELDESHFEETFSVSEGKFQALKLLRRISLAMEVIGISTIEEEDFHELIPDSKDFQLVKYCTVFNKEIKETGKWKFEHNYFREFLCAELLSKQSFEVVKSFICIQNFDKVLPNWFNTVAQLISILDKNDELFKDLIQWLIKNDSEVLVNVEREKLSIEIREEIFKQIFEYYKGLKIWIDSNKFNDKDLAYFGQSNNSISFIIGQASAATNHRITRINALSILGGFDLIEFPDKEALKSLLLHMVEEEKSDSFFVFNIIHTLIKCNFTDKETAETLYSMVGSSNSQYIRASMYKFFFSCTDFEKYIEYYIEGYRLLKVKDEGRDDTNLFDEGANLREGIKSFRSPEALKRIIDFSMESHLIERDFEADELLTCIVKNTVIAFKEQDTIYNSVFELMKYHSKYWHHQEPNIILSFFEETDTKLRAFNEALTALKEPEDSYYSSMLLAHLADSSSIEMIIGAYNEGKINSNQLDRIYWDIKFVNQLLSEDLKAQVDDKTDHSILIPVQKNWDNLRHMKTQESFDLLFDHPKFLAECLNIFEERDELTLEELTSIRKRGFNNTELEELFTESALDLVRDFASYNPVEKVKLTEWINETGNFEWYRISESFMLLKRDANLDINDSQILILKEWFEKYIKIIDFTKAITKVHENSFSVVNNARYLVFLMKRFGFDCPESVLLDMLSFSFGNIVGVEDIQIEDILKSVEKGKVNKRIIENINGHRIEEFSIYETHVKYALANKLKDSFATIIDDIIHSNFRAYKKNSIIESYIDAGNDINKLKEVFDEFDIEVKIHTLSKLLILGEYEFVTQKLLIMHEVETNEEYLLNINNLLISAKQIVGLEYSIDWIKRNKRSPFSQNGQGLAYFNDIKALPKLIELLELSYDKTICTEHNLDKLWGIVINGIEFLALTSIENFELVRSEIADFIEQNKNKLEDVEFINRPFEKIKEKMYNNLTTKYDIRSAIEMIDKSVK